MRLISLQSMYFIIRIYVCHACVIGIIGPQIRTKIDIELTFYISFPFIELCEIVNNINLFRKGTRFFLCSANVHFYGKSENFSVIVAKLKNRIVY